MTALPGCGRVHIAPACQGSRWTAEGGDCEQSNDLDSEPGIDQFGGSYPAADQLTAAERRDRWRHLAGIARWRDETGVRSGAPAPSVAVSKTEHGRAGPSPTGGANKG